MSRTTFLKRGALAGTGLAALLTLGAAVPAGADTGGSSQAAPSPSDSAAPGSPGHRGLRLGGAGGGGLGGLRNGNLAERADRLCARVPQAEERLGQVIATITAGADTRGSVKWLQAKAEQVRSKDPTLASLLDGRAQIRQAELPVLKLRQEQLPKVTAWCKAHGRTTGG